MRPEDLARLHARCFAMPPPWPASAFDGLLESRGSFLIAEPDGFVLGRVTADEAELLTLAVAPEQRRKGLGRRLTRRFADQAREAGAQLAFLEVAADNDAAQALYRDLGWREAGRRKGYYAPGIDAIVMRHELRTCQEGS